MTKKPENRMTVSTYVPQYQKEEWKADADAMDMNLSEFIRLMTQAGRRGFDLSESDGADSPTGGASAESRDDLTEQIETMLSEVEPLTSEEIVQIVAGGVDDRVHTSLIELQNQGRVLHGRDGYELTGSRE